MKILAIILPVILAGGWLVGHLAFPQCDRPIGLARTQLEVLAAKIDSFALDNGHVPSSLKELTVEGEMGAYAKPGELVDPWRGPVYYHVRDPAGSFILFTLGSDGRLGGEGMAEDIQIERSGAGS